MRKDMDKTKKKILITRILRVCILAAAAVALCDLTLIARSLRP